MASATSVTSVSHVPFRRFLPHEKQKAPSTSRQDYHENNDVGEDDSGTLPGLPQPLLSDEDIIVLMEAGHPEDDWGQPREQADTLYLPFTFSLAANQ